MRNFLTASILSLAALGGSAVFAPRANASSFVESYTSADLLLDSEDSIITTVGVGKAFINSNSEISAGVGYAAGSGDAVAVRVNARTFQELGNQFTLEGEITGVYLSNTDQLVVTPEVRIRRWFD